MTVIRNLTTPAALTTLLVVAASAANPLFAQLPDAGALSRSWFRQWSPLAEGSAVAGDLARAFPAAELPAPLLMTAPAPSIGLLWSTGNPAGAARDLAGAYREFSGGRQSTSGSYRRSFDPDDARAYEARGFGWQRFGAERRGAAIGAVTVRSVTAGDLPFAITNQPYTSSPLVPSDTSRSEMDGTAVMVESGLAWRAGAWSAGLGVGYTATTWHTDAAPLAKQGRSAMPAGVLGLTRTLGDDRLTIGVLGRVVHRTESVLASPAGGTGQAFVLTGYTEVEPINLVSVGIVRHIDRDAASGGLSVEAHIAGATLLAFGELGTVREEQRAGLHGNPPIDRWIGDTRLWGIAARSTFLGGRLQAAGSLRHSVLEGDAHRADLDGIFYRGTAELGAGELDVRLTPDDDRWTIAVAALVRREVSDRADYVERIGTRVDGWTPAVTMEAARAVTSTVRLGLGVSGAWYASSSRLPVPTTASALYQRVFAPELAIAATPLTARAASITGAWRRPRRATLWLRLTYGTRIPGESIARSQLGLDGSRSSWSVMIGSSTRG